MKWQVQFTAEQTQHCSLPAHLSEGVPFVAELESKAASCNARLLARSLSANSKAESGKKSRYEQSERANIQVRCMQRGRHILLLHERGDGMWVEENLTVLAQEVSSLRHGRSKVMVLYTTQAGKLHSCRAVVGLAAVSMPTAQADSMQASEVVSPLTGKVIKVLVAEGAKVQLGERLVIIEAMKMENVVQAEGSGVVAALNVKVGDVVRSGDVLLSLRGKG